MADSSCRQAASPDEASLLQPGQLVKVRGIVHVEVDPTNNSALLVFATGSGGRGFGVIIDAAARGQLSLDPPEVDGKQVCAVGFVQDIEGGRGIRIFGPDQLAIS